MTGRPLNNQMSDIESQNSDHSPYPRMRVNQSPNYSQSENAAPNLSSSQKQDYADNHINQKDLTFHFSKEKFIGTWQTDHYSIERKYIVVNYDQQISLFCTILQPTNPFASIIIVHDFNDHHIKYLNIADHFARNKLSVILYDQRGLGLSGGSRQNSSIKEMHEDFDLILNQTDRQLPVFVYCHSTGVAIVYSFCITNTNLNLQGIISTNAFVKIPSRLNFKKKFAVSILTWLVPNILISSNIDLSHLSKNNYHIKKVVDDPLFSPIMSIKQVQTIIEMCEYIKNYSQKIQSPVLLIHGKEDKITQHMNTLDLYKIIGSKEKSVKLYEYGFHELHSDVEVNRMSKMIISWCNKQVKANKKLIILRDIIFGIEKSNNYWTKFTVLLIIIMFLTTFQKKYFQSKIQFFFLEKLDVSNILAHFGSRFYQK